MPSLVDTHCHLYWDQFDDLDDVVARARRNGIDAMIVPGINLETSETAIALAEQYASLYVAVGVHPNDVGGGDLADTLKELAMLAQHDKVVAVGEIGLDYYWDKTPHDVQAAWLQGQLELASDLDLPVILHNRESTTDILEVLTTWRNTGSTREQPGVMHSFSGTVNEAQAAVDLGFYIGLTGPITFKNGQDMRAVAEAVPLGRLLVETDAPFLTPHPYRGKRNEPAYVRFVAEKLAEVRGITFMDASAATSKNALELFRIALQ